jgi:hypothetical protein
MVAMPHLDRQSCSPFVKSEVRSVELMTTTLLQSQVGRATCDRLNELIAGSKQVASRTLAAIKPPMPQERAAAGRGNPERMTEAWPGTNWPGRRRPRPGCKPKTGGALGSVSVLPRPG